MNITYFTFLPFDKLSNIQLYKILEARQEVFQIEQGIHYNDCDKLDYQAWHLCLWSKDGEELMAYLRLLPPSPQKKYHSVGRVLTTSRYREQGFGKALMNELLTQYQEIIDDVPLTMSAQAYLREFYQRFGFSPESDVYMEEGIAHIRMTRY